MSEACERIISTECAGHACGVGVSEACERIISTECAGHACGVGA